MIPVFEPFIGEEEAEAVAQAVRDGEISGSFGKNIDLFENEFAEYCECRYGVAVTSGTTALHLAVAAAGIGKGDEILVSASTNIATALAVVHNGAVPVPVDSEEKSWNIDLKLIENLITEKTRAIIPVHLFGYPVDMIELMDIAEKHKLIVIEDCAESHGALCRQRKTGSFGDLGCFSFYANKIITTGEGGMIVTSNSDLAEKMKLLRNLAFTQPRFRHEVLGYNFRMTGYQAAMGRVQLKKIDDIIRKKREVARLYKQCLLGIPGVVLPHEAEWAKNVYWMFGIVIKDLYGLSRDELMVKLKEKGIDTRTFFCPMNQQPCLQDIPGFKKTECPVADSLWQTGLYLPSSINLTQENIEYISNTIRDFSK